MHRNLCEATRVTPGLRNLLLETPKAVNAHTRTCTGHGTMDQNEGHKPPKHPPDSRNQKTTGPQPHMTENKKRRTGL